MSEQKEEKEVPSIAKPKWLPNFLAKIWNVTMERHKARVKPSEEEQSKTILADSKAAESALIKYIATINAGSVLATLALIGQVKDKITKAELMTIAEGMDQFICGIILIGFGMMASVIFHWAHWGRFYIMSSLLRLAFLGLSITAFFKFIWGVKAVVAALLKAF